MATRRTTPPLPAEGPPNGTDEGWVDFRLGFQPALNGLRGVAVVSIMIFHGVIAYKGTIGSSFLPGAYLGLEVFFVQSGFLITSLLLEEWHRTGGIRLRRFYARRALRLLPALFLVLALTSLALLTFSTFKGNYFAWREVWVSLFYAQNWFNAFRPSPFPFYLNHLWSLSIEEQFYLVAPVLLVAGLRSRLTPRRMVPIAVALTFLSVGWMALLAHHARDAIALGRLYYGTDTRAQGLLVGVALACAIHGGLWLRTDRSARIARVWAWLGVVALVWLLLVADVKLRSAYEGLFLVCSVSVAGMLSEVVCHPRGRFARAVSVWPLRASGAIAYGLYLWHWPVMLVMRQYVHLSIQPMILLQIAASFPVAITSYFLLERPLLRRFSGRFARVSAERETAHRARQAASTALAG